MSASQTGKKHSLEQNAKLSAYQKGRKRKPCSAETKDKIRIAHLARSVNR